MPKDWILSVLPETPDPQARRREVSLSGFSREKGEKEEPDSVLKSPLGSSIGVPSTCVNTQAYRHTRACILSCFSHVQLFLTHWTVACQAPLSMGFSRQEYWCGLPCPPPGDLPHPGIEPESVTSPALVGLFFTTSTTWEARHTHPYLTLTNGALVLPILCHQGRGEVRCFGVSLAS